MLLQAISFFVVLVFLATAVQGKSSFTIPASDPGFQYMGRFQPTSPSTMSFDWSSSTIAFTLFRKAGPGPGSYQAALLLSDNSQNWYKLFVNGVHVFDFAAGSNTGEYPLTGQDLWYNTSYEVVLIKRTEASNNNQAAVFLGVAVSDEAVELLPRPAAPNGGQRRMFFFGDSITCGYADLGSYDSTCEQATSELEDDYFSYGPVTARSFGAEYQVVSWQGKGVVRNYLDPNQLSTCPNCPMPYYFNKTIGTSPLPIYPFAEFVPEVIVCNLGTNDYSTSPWPTQQQFETGYQQLVAQFRQAYPQAEVFLACGPMTHAFVCSYIQNVAALTNAHFINQTVVDLQNTSLWSCGHPNVEGHYLMAQATVPIISETMAWPWEPEALTLPKRQDSKGHSKPRSLRSRSIEE